MEPLPGPGFPAGGIISPIGGLAEKYMNGKRKDQLLGKIDISNWENGRPLRTRWSLRKFRIYDRHEYQQVPCGRGRTGGIKELMTDVVDISNQSNKDGSITSCWS